VDEYIARTLPRGQHELLALSRTTLSHHGADPSWDASTKTYLCLPQERTQPALGEAEPSYWLQQSTSYFVHVFSDAYKLWPLYNVLLIKWKDGVAHRLGLGKIHIDAFDPAAETKEIILG